MMSPDKIILGSVLSGSADLNVLQILIYAYLNNMFYVCLLDSKPIVEGFTDSAPPCGKLSLQLEKNIVVSRGKNIQL